MSGRIRHALGDSQIAISRDLAACCRLSRNLRGKLVGEAAEVIRGSETNPDREITLWDDAGMLGRLVHELSRAYGTDDARRVVLHVVRNSLPTDEVARETRLAAQGYTLSVENSAVLGCFAGTYFMRSKGGRSLTLPVDQTPIKRLECEWRKFRSSALG